MKIRRLYLFCFSLMFLSLLSSAQNSDTLFYDGTTLPREISKLNSNNVIAERATYYKSGKLLSRSYYKNGLLDGTVTGYYEDGKKEFEFNY
jgi:antitoxin component YwqK of YwqJK toxin-antitoxin module